MAAGVRPKVVPCQKVDCCHVCESPPFPRPAQDQASLIAQESQAWIEKAVASARPTGAAPLRMAVQVGALDSRLALAPCAQVEPYMPIGTRLWGKTRIGLRCIDGASRWNVFLPVQV